MHSVRVYGADWCEDTQRTRELLETLKVEYDYIDIEKDEDARQWVKEQNNGKESKPTLKVGTQVLSVPADNELISALKSEKVLAG